MKKRNKGAILIEAILGITIATIITTGLVSALVSSLSNSTFSRGQTIATGYAQENMELIRSLKDVDYSSLEGSVGSCTEDSPCRFDFNSGNGRLISGSDDIDDDASKIIFERSIVILDGASHDCEGSIFAQVTVAWQDSKCSGSAKCHEVNLRSCFSNLDYVELP